MVLPNFWNPLMSLVPFWRAALVPVLECYVIHQPQIQIRYLFYIFCLFQIFIYVIFTALTPKGLWQPKWLFAIFSFCTFGQATIST
jgi:hypothetical protein